MARILCISSQVARGTVGLSVMVPALQRLGHEVIALPTVLLSNHPGHPRVAGGPVPSAQLAAMVDALGGNGWLGAVDAVLSGYLPSAGHARLVAEAVTAVNSARAQAGRPLNAIYLCDPVLGDDPKGLYIDVRAAEAIRETLLPMADVVTPNRFEVAYLASPAGTADVRTLEAARVALGSLGARVGVGTSIPGAAAGEIVNLMVAAGGSAAARVPLRASVPHGTGDLFAALLLSALVQQVPARDALAAATAGVDQVLAASEGLDQLALAALPSREHHGMRWPIEIADGGDGGGTVHAPLLPARRR